MNKVLTAITFSLPIPTICSAVGEGRYQIKLYQYTGNISKQATGGFSCLIQRLVKLKKCILSKDDWHTYTCDLINMEHVKN
jgi:hypothetical protein